jgi:hypothetical protein
MMTGPTMMNRPHTDEYWEPSLWNGSLRRNSPDRRRGSTIPNPEKKLRMASEADSDSRHHPRKMQTIDHLRQDVGKVDESQLKAMLETSAEVLTGLKKAFGNYEQKNESA